MPVVETNGIETYYERHGSGTPIVCVHGGWLDHRMWEPQVEALQDEFELVTYDVRGHGRTGGSDRRRYSVALFADDLRALVEALALDRPVVCGLSLGGMVAQAYAARYPDGLGGLVLADTAVSTAFTRRDRLLQWLFPAWAMTLSVRLVGPERYANFAFWLANRLRGADWFGRDEAVRNYVHGTMASFDTAEYNKIYRAIYAFREVDLANIAVPTLVCYGEFEDGTVKDHAAYLERTIPDARAVEIPDAGHTSNMENPDRFSAALAEFCATLEASDGS